MIPDSLFVSTGSGRYTLFSQIGMSWVTPAVNWSAKIVALSPPADVGTVKNHRTCTLSSSTGVTDDTKVSAPGTRTTPSPRPNVSRSRPGLFTDL